MRSTVHLDAGRAADVRRAGKMVRAGRLVAFATETVYGLGANALDAAAVAEIFEAKERPGWDPLIVHLAATTEIASVARVEPALEARVAALTEAFWPGPLTLLLPRTGAVPDAVTAGRPLVGVRVPAHPAAQLLLRAAKVPIAAPSANRFGHMSPTTATHVFADLNGRIDAVLDGGPAGIGLESTVLDPAPTPMVIYRSGAVTAEDLERVTGVAAVSHDPPSIPGSDAERAGLPSPGVGMRHYAPHARVLLCDGSPEALRAAVAEGCEKVRCEDLEGGVGRGVGVLLPLGWEAGEDCTAEPWAAWEDLPGLAAGLFAGLRALEASDPAVIVCPLPAAGPGLAAALRDRLTKAARPD